MEEVLMRKQISAIAMIFLLAASATANAMASSHKAGHAGRHAKNSHPVRSAESWHQGDTSYRGGFIDLGPLGITAACGSYRSRHYCGQGYSVSAWSY
jgi:hypothetical protein